jgi:hypothetical protein
MSIVGKRLLVPIAGLLFSACVMAAEPAAKAPDKAPDAAPEPPELPMQDVIINGEVIEPEVRIIKQEESTIYEYRINGHLYMAKVQPVVGPPYYLVDRNGDGEFDSRSTDPANISVPQWILLRW